ncbi:MAG: T9SS type A sorting domain-containing protein [Saprospiraceae bacterium]|nr:T9SS type A sorting domain-containing protein [Saprospiraceae bacterium]
MLAGNVPMSYEDVARVRDWINSGAFQASRALPVVLTDFSAYNEEDKKVVLYWQTSSEYNTAFFEIENSGDGIQFNTIGKKQASSNPNVLTNYEFTDLTPGFGNQYYRLKMTDHDGLISYSSTRAVRLKSNVETLKIYPSSLQNNDPLFIEWIASDNSEIAKIQILDIIGRLVFTTIINPGINQTTIPALSPGLYYAVIPHDIENYFVKKMIMIH